MASTKYRTITFIVSGEDRASYAAATRAAAAAGVASAGSLRDSGLPASHLKQSVLVGSLRSGAGKQIRVDAEPDSDVVVLHITGGPVLVLHPENARDLLLAQTGTGKNRSARSADRISTASLPREVVVPAQLQWRGLESEVATRGTLKGFLGDAVLYCIEVFKGPVKDAAADLAVEKIMKKVDGQVVEGVYRLSPESLAKPETKPEKITTNAINSPVLVLIHGTFSSTSGTFGKFWIEHPQHIRALFAHYQNRVYALDHATLGSSPIDNALMLARALPAEARLHLLTHSRGGLVAEVLALAGGISQQVDAGLDRFTDEDRAALLELSAIMREKQIKVERVVRVGCPARGTLLASKRLDAYLSVFTWAMQLAQIPVLPQLVEYLHAIAQRRADPELIPGLAAQIPDSPLIQWLHNGAAIAGQLRVIAGDMEGDSVTSWLKTMLADAFYWVDNDLVVQTGSMYGGTPREAGASFFLHQDGKVSHFNYFSNQQTAGAAVDALINETPAGFKVIGPLSWAGKSSTGERARRRPEDGIAAARPAVFLLPGELGSNLKVKGKRVWLDLNVSHGFASLAYKPERADQVEPDGPIGTVYNDLSDYLSETHEVIEFAYDWRRPIEDEARRLGKAIEAALDARAGNDQPVRVIAHSMGGIVARTLQLECPHIWTRMMSRRGARMLMLGTPNAGTWTPMQCLSGDDTFNNMFVAVGAPFKEHETRKLMAGFPGFMQLQAGLLDDDGELAHFEKWQLLADNDYARVSAQSIWHRDTWHNSESNRLQLSPYEWGVPDQNVLNRAVELRRRLDVQASSDFASFKDKLLLVIGHAEFTPDGYREDPEGLVYLNVQGEGDGRVTHHSAQQLGVRTWQLDCEHGKLPNAKRAFEGYRQLLEDGSTSLLKEVPRTRARSATAGTISRPSRQRTDSTPPESASDIWRTTGMFSNRISADGDTALQITIVNSDLVFIHQPLMVGHYSATRLTGTEKVINKLTGGLMKKSLAAGLYPNAPGEHQIFDNIGVNPHYPLQSIARPRCAIVVGLGEEGKLRASELAMSVRQAVIAWAQRMAEEKSAGRSFELAASLIGSGGSGISAGKSALLISQAVREANDKLKVIGWPVVDHLYLVELYLERASEAWRALQVQVTATPGYYKVTDSVQPGMGALPRPLDSSYRGAAYDFISVQAEAQHGSDATISYALDTRRARTEVTAQRSQRPLLQELITTASNSDNRDPHISRTLFRLLVPIEVEPFLGGTSEMVIEVNQGTAGIPWELLDTGSAGGADDRPWAIRSKLIRKLRLDDFRPQMVNANTEVRVLIIGEPACDPDRYAPLPGAQLEALAVYNSLLDKGRLEKDKVCALIENRDSSRGPLQSRPDARTVINALIAHDWRIMHVAGHGEPPEERNIERTDQFAVHEFEPRGVVLSNNTYLGPREICAMRVVPELVFVNCCHLAKRNPAQLLAAKEFNRAQFAASVAESLIRIGVRCVVAAGWAVEDGPARVFAETFYKSLLGGQRFMDAVTYARIAAREEGGNTWAAYQCYGDPDWIFTVEARDAQRPEPVLADEFSGVASARSLILALQTLEVRSNFQDAPALRQREKISYLEARFSADWGNQGNVAEAFALAWAATHDTRNALKWYELAVAAEDGSASIKATEQLYNFKIRHAWEVVDAARAKWLRLRQSLPARNTRARKNSGRAIASSPVPATANGELKTAIGEARGEIANAAKQLEILNNLQPSMERAALCGSAFKRLALIETVAGHVAAATAALEKMRFYYEQAAKIGAHAQHQNAYFPQLNVFCAELVMNVGQSEWQGFDPAVLAWVKTSLLDRMTNEPDFWSAIGSVELQIYEAVGQRTLAAEAPHIKGAYEDIRARISAAWKWASVYDQMSLVLPAYMAVATGPEREAAENLLETLRKIAEPEGEEKGE